MEPLRSEDLINNNLPSPSSHLGVGGVNGRKTLLRNCTVEEELVMDTSMMSTDSSDVKDPDDVDNNPGQEESNGVTSIEDSLDLGPVSLVVSRDDAKTLLCRTQSADYPDSLWNSNLTHSEEYLDDTPSDFDQYMMSILEYEDPSFGYQFVSEPSTVSHLDNAEALLDQLRGLGVSVNRDYLTLDIDFSLSGPNSLQDTSSEDHHSSSETCFFDRSTDLQSQDSSVNSSPPSEPPKIPGRFLRELAHEEQSTSFEPLSLTRSLSEEHEVAEAYFTPDGNFKVVYDNLSKEYRSGVSRHQDHVQYLQLLHMGETSSDGEAPYNPCGDAGGAGTPLDSRIQRLRARLASNLELRLKQRHLLLVKGRHFAANSNLRGDLKDMANKFPPRLKDLPDRCKFRIRKLLGEIISLL